MDAAAKAATDKIMQDARAQMTPEQRANLDRNMPPRQSLRTDTECITEAEAAISPKQMLQDALQSMHQPPWACTFGQERADATGVSFDYRCTTAANALAEGKARFEAGERRYRSEINGRSHVVNMQTGAPLHSRLVTGRSLTIGQWLAERCER